MERPIALGSRSLGNRDQIGHPGAIHQRTRVQELTDVARPPNLQRVQVQPLDLAQRRGRDVRPPTFDASSAVLNMRAAR